VGRPAVSGLLPRSALAQDVVAAARRLLGCVLSSSTVDGEVAVRLVEVAKDPAQNIMPVTIELVRAGASMGDIVERLKKLWGTYRENPVF